MTEDKKSLEEELKGLKPEKLSLEEELRNLGLKKDSPHPKIDNNLFESLFGISLLKARSYCSESEITDRKKEHATIEEMNDYVNKRNNFYQKFLDLIQPSSNPKDYKMIVESLKNETKFNSEKNPYHYLIIGMYDLNKKREEAEKAFEKALDLDPNEIDIANKIGFLYSAVGKIKEAEDILKKASQIEPKEKKWGFELVEKANKRDKEEDRFSKMLENDTDTIKSEIYILLSSIYLRQKKFKEAEDTAKKALILDHNYEEAKKNLGLAYYNQKKFNEAEHYLKEAGIQDENDPLLLFKLSVCLMYNEKNIEAVSNLEKMLKLKPNLIEQEKIKERIITTYLSAMMESDKKGDEKKAEELAKNALKIEEDGIIYSFLGYLFEKQNRREEATEAFRKAIELNPEDGHNHIELGLNNLMYINEEVFQKNIHTLIREGYGKINGYAKTIWDMIVDEKLTEAEKSFEKATKLANVSANPFLLLGTAYFNHYKYSGEKRLLKKAEEALEKGIEANPDNPELYRSLGSIQVNQNRYKKAKTAYEKAIELGNEEAKEELEELEKSTSWFRKIFS